MVTIDLASTSVREANEVIRKYGADGTDVELVNPDARHHLGVGLVHPINVRIRGSAGYFCAGLTDAAFIIRAKSNTRYERRYSHPADKTTGVRCDQTVVLTGAKGRKHYPQPPRRIKYYDAGTEKTFNFLTNHFAVSAPTVAQLYRYRWQVELFFKWIKQHLRIKSFFGTSENAVKTQIWIAVTVYVLVAVLRKRLGISADLYTILQVLSLTLFEKMPIFKLFSDTGYNLSNPENPNQLILLE